MATNSAHLIIFLALVVSAANSFKFETSRCSDHIVQFPEYRCSQQHPFGKGASGITFTVKRRDKTFILKVQKLTPKKDKALNDLKFLEILRPSEHVIDLIDHKEVGEYLYEILEFGTKGDLDHYIQKNPNKFKDKVSILKFFLQMVEAVMYIHSKEVTHNDLKPENIVLMGDDRLKLIDFDVALPINTLARGRGTLEFMDPEVIDSWGKRAIIFNDKRDIYSLGVILFFMSQGKYPFNAQEKVDDWKRVHTRPFYSFSKGTPTSVAKIAALCLIATESDRPSLGEIKQMVEEGIAEPTTPVLNLTTKINNRDKNPFNAKGAKPRTQTDQTQNQAVQVKNQAEEPINQNIVKVVDEGLDTTGLSSFYSKIRFLVVGILVALVFAPWIIWLCFFKSSNEPEPSGIQAQCAQDLKAGQLNIRDLEVGLK